MALTPIDIHNKEFERSFRGYSIEEVNEFLERVARDFEHLIKEKQSMEEELNKIKEIIKSYQKLETTMHNAIIVAQETAEEVKRNASKEAEIICKEAERDASHIIEEARYKSSRILAEHEELHKQVQIFKMRFRSFIEAQLSSLELEDWTADAPVKSTDKDV